ncbi:MAG TPA: 2-oxo acid dehydrogenase subunit E2 [Steroidobacteraceae bacterium]|nr:2-oxo acid dehydrogenase subunit E2 [Steroidobacteraceae bacterium]
MSGIADVIAPSNEEGTKATILRWYKAAGDSIRKDEPLLELETDKVTVEIPSPASGELCEILKQPDEEVLPGQVLARVRTTVHDAAVPAQVAPEAAASSAEGARRLLSPAVRRQLDQQGLSPGDIVGSGQGGRITARDIERHVGAKASRLPHTAIRRRVAEHMARSLALAPHVTTLFEADLTRVLAHRSGNAAAFERQGARLTLTAYFVAACAQALHAHPAVNATYHEDALELHPDANIGVGTALGNDGLIVPVIHRAQELDLLAIARRLGELVGAARSGKLAPEEVRGGTFTISNHGVGGSLLAAPIVINQPQVAILGVGKLERRVVALEAHGAEAIGVRPKCYLTLTIDHRALDGFQANAFLTHVVNALEQWA